MAEKFDRALFRALNEEYRDKPLVRSPPEVSPSGFQVAAERRIATLSRYVDVAGKRVLELGTGRGYAAAALETLAGASEVIALDIARRAEWDHHRTNRVRFIEGDLASADLVEASSIDVIVSAAVLEHVSRPVRMLEALHRILRIDGTAWLYFNLYRGPKASHCYRQIFFPWPHLLFDEGHAVEGVSGFAWVNRMTAAEYVLVCVELGFEITTLRRHTIALEDYLDFYLRFEDKLGRYPALDLETDFMTLVLRKTTTPGEPTPTLGYLSRQRHLDMLLERFHS